MKYVQLFSLIVFSLGAIFFWRPALERWSRGNALISLLGVHVFRVLVLWVIPAQRGGLPVSDAAVTEIVTGDLSGAAIALVSIVALHRRSSLGIPFAWLVLIETFADIGVAIHRRLVEPLNVEPSGPLYFVLAFFVPLMLVTLPLLIWQLSSRWKEPLS